jgi:hypothetical protein
VVGVPVRVDGVLWRGRGSSVHKSFKPPPVAPLTHMFAGESDS